MHKPYPDLKDRQEEISRVILNEETSCINTLSQSSTLLDKAIETIKNSLENDPKIDDFTIASNATSAALGSIAFRLYDTNGIPLEIVKEELDKKHIKVDKNFEIVYQGDLDKQKNLSKLSSKMKGDVFDAKGLGLKLEATKFIGYRENSAQAAILAILKDGKEVKWENMNKIWEYVRDKKRVIEYVKMGVADLLKEAE